MIHVIATIELNPGTRDAFLVEFRQVTEEVRAEAGCLEYGAAVDEPTSLAVQEAVGPDAVVVVEKWEDPAALLAHLKAPHMAAYRQRVQDYVRGVKLLVLRPV
jgi:quinol monooxygenase YgiN